MTETELKIEYAERSSSYELPDDIELALEKDYIVNRHLYTENTFIDIKSIFDMCNSITPKQMLEMVKRNIEIG